jgi:hypothetical protein
MNGRGDVLDDMVDVPGELDRWPLLRDRLERCRAVLSEPYTSADREALYQQRHHRWITLIAVLFGTLALLVALFELTDKDLVGHPDLLLAIDLGATLIAVAAVTLGIIAGRQRRWLVERHKAERFRMARFQCIVDAVLWGGSPDDLERRLHQLGRQGQDIGALDHAALHNWIKDDQILDVPAPAGAIDPDTLKQLAGYYAARRLDTQMEFFSRRAEGNETWDWWTRHLPPILFFGSVGLALAHFVYDLVSWAWPGLDLPSTSSVWLVVLAAALPIISAAIRTYRTAKEYGRNSIRYRGKLVALRRLAERLEKEKDPDAIVRDLWCCEQILESEHREWLRLMIESEWY